MHNKNQYKLRTLFLRLTLIMAATLITLAMGGCSQPKTYKIGVSQCSQDDWRKKMNDEIQREMMFHSDAKVEIRSADDSNEKQIADIRYFADNDFDIIIAAPNEADAITPVIKEVYAKGIPVLIFDRNIHGDSYTAFQGADNKAIGRQAAKYAANITHPRAKAIEIYGLAGSTPADERHKGFRSAADSIGIQTIGMAYGDWNYDDAYRVADSLLRLHPDAEIVYAHNDRMAIAAHDVAKKLNLNPKIIGIDAAPEIGMKAVADGTIDATFLYPTEGQHLIRTALAILKNEPYPKNTIFPAASAVDKSNADILLMQNNEIIEGTSKMKLLKTNIDQYWEKHSAQTTLFYSTIAIAVLLAAIIFLMLREFWQRKKHQKTLENQNRLLAERNEMQKQLNEQLEATTHTKLVFFTNVSHDLRTPLTLISAPIEELAGADNLTPKQHSLMEIARKNISILRRLINQILDFRKFENGKMELNLEPTDFSRDIEEWSEGFRQLARSRDIKFSLRREPEGAKDYALAAIDREKMERIYYNIVSNAFKYTLDNGRIDVVWKLTDTELKFRVVDSGRGMSAEDLSRIFERFFQVDKIHPQGSGIGLSLAKAMAELHGGSVSAESKEGKGSVFYVSVPRRKAEAEAAGGAAAVEKNSDKGKEPLSMELAGYEELLLNDIPEEDTSNDEEGGDQRPLVLVVDDNEDMRKLLRILLSKDYRVITAADGKEGIRKATTSVPDLIICDVMMPVMDGLECCRRLKAEMTTSHIPVLMLTACSHDEQRCAGYESGADGYISKPFREDVMLARCASLIANRRRIVNLWKETGAPSAPSSSVPKPEEKNRPGTEIASDAPAAESRPAALGSDIDNRFYQKFVEIFEARMSEAELNVDTLASEMGLGRSQFYRKIKQLTNYSPVELMRKMRMRQARELLTKTDRSISEIAYGVGFSTPAYFTKCFRQSFGETPTELRQRLGR